MDTTGEGDRVLLLLELSEIELVLIVWKQAGVNHGIFPTPRSIYDSTAILISLQRENYTYMILYYISL